MAIDVEAELKRQPAGGGALVSWELVNDAENPDTGRADPVIDYGVRSLLAGQITVGFLALEDANNTTAGVVIPAFAGVVYAPNVGGAPGAGTADMWVGDWTECKNFAGVTVNAGASALGRGYAEFSNDAGATIAYYYTTLFAGAGDFTTPADATHVRIAFQNLSAGNNSFRVETLLKSMPSQSFISPVIGPIDPTFPALLTRSVIAGQQPDGDFENQPVSGSESGNSTTTPLGISGVFTGTAFDATGYTAVTVIVESDVASAADGLLIEYAEDAAFTFVHRTEVLGTYDTPGEGRTWIRAVNQGEYYRVSYTNGTVAQARFLLRAELTVGVNQTAISPLTSRVDDNTNVELVRAVTAGRTPDDAFLNLGILGTLTLTPAVAALGSNATYTSDIFDFEQYSSVRLAIATDQISATDGVKIRWYDDAVGTREVGEETFTYSTSDVTATHKDLPALMMRSRYVQIIYVNGSSAQGFLVIIPRFNPYPTARRIDIGPNQRGANTAITGADTTTHALTFSTPTQRTIAFKAHPSNQSSVLVHVGFNVDGSQNWPLAAGDSIEYDCTENTTLYYRFTSITGSPVLFVAAIGDPL